MSPKDKYQDREIDWNDTSYPAVQQAEREEHEAEHDHDDGDHDDDIGETPAI